MAGALILEEVTLERAPGFDRDRLPGLSGLGLGLNVVWGPNGIGKSTLARAMKGLLWRSGDESLEAMALARAAGRAWRLERRGSVLRQTGLDDPAEANGQSGGQSSGQWGGQADADRYWFPLHDLLDRTNQGQAFQAEILSEMQGGVDLDLACAQAGGDPRPLSPRAQEWVACNKAIRAHSELSAEHGRQRWIRDEIAQAEAALTRSLEAAKGLDRNRRLQAHLRAQGRLASAQAALERFPRILDRISAGDPLRLQEGEARRDALEEEARTLGEALRERRERLEALGVPAGLLEPGRKRDLLEAREILLALEPEGRQTRAALAAAEAAERAWREAFGWLMPRPPEAARLQTLLGSLRALAQESEPLRCALGAARQRLEALGPREPAPPQDHPQVWMELQEILREWQRQALVLAAPPPAPAIPPRSALRAVGAALLLALAAAGLAILRSPFLALSGLLTPALLWVLLRPRGAQEDPRAAAARAACQDLRTRAEGILAAFPELRPGGWSPLAVLDLQGQAVSRMGRAEARGLREAERERASRDLAQAQGAYALWLERWRGAAGALGLREGDPLLSGTPFFHAAQGLLDWGQRLEALAVARRARDEKDGQIRKARERLAGLLNLWGAGEGLAPEGLAGRTGDLLERREAAVLLADQLRGLEERLELKTREVAKAGEELEAFWRDRGFLLPDPAELQALAALDEPRKEAERERRLAAEELERDADPALAAAAQAATLEALAASALELQEEAGRQEERTQALLELKVRYDGLVEKGALAQAMDAELRAREALEEARRQAAINQVVHLLAEDLKEKVLKEEQPRVLRGASARLRHFTAGRFELGIRPGRGFFARDTVGNRILELDELSSGTRVQLLFAVRLAFIEVKEGDGLRMPVFLDEVLANSDDERARAMIAAILEIARERQVFYFTAQADEVAKLQAAAEDGPVALFPLHELSLEQEQARAPLRAIDLDAYAPPEPLEDYGAYGLACGASEARCFDPVEGLHAWHLFLRSQDLHFFLVRGASRVGQILASPLPEAQAPRRRAELLRRAQLLAQAGRGRPFRFQDLEDARLAGVNPNAEYWKAIRAAAEAAGGDGFAFREALAGVNRAGKARAVIETWLAEQGHVSEGRPFTGEEILLALFEGDGDLEAGSEEHRVLERYLRAIAPEAGHA